MKKVFNSNKTCIRTGFRRTKNLKDLLVPSALPDVDRVNGVSSDTLGCFRCDRQVCDACHNFLLPAKRIKSVVTGKSYKIRQSLSCRTDYIIYCAICTICNKQCVGSSVKIRARLSNHKSHIKQRKRTCRLVNHFIDNFHHHQLSNLKFVLIERPPKLKIFLNKEKDIGRPNCGLMSPTASMLGKNLILGGDVNSLVKATATYNFPPNL